MRSTNGPGQPDRLRPNSPALLPTDDDLLVAFAAVDEPTTTPDEALVAVEAFSVNRGEILPLMAGRVPAPAATAAALPLAGLTALRLLRACGDVAGRRILLAGASGGVGHYLVELVASGRLHPEIGERADWSETPRVLAAVRDRAVRGNAVLTVR